MYRHKSILIHRPRERQQAEETTGRKREKEEKKEGDPKTFRASREAARPNTRLSINIINVLHPSPEHDPVHSPQFLSDRWKEARKATGWRHSVDQSRDKRNRLSLSLSLSAGGSPCHLAHNTRLPLRERIMKRFPRYANNNSRLREPSLLTRPPIISFQRISILLIFILDSKYIYIYIYFCLRRKKLKNIFPIIILSFVTEKGIIESFPRILISVMRHALSRKIP